MREFVRFPARLYKDDSLWAPPIRMDERTAYRKDKNAILIHSDYELLVVYDDQGRTAGRCLVHIDHTYNRYYQSKTGFFGAFECVDSYAAAELLLNEAAAWLGERGMDRMLGPINPVAEFWGFLLEGFDTPPVFLSPYNPPYYNDMMERYGMGKAKDLLSLEASREWGYAVPGRFEEFAERFLKRHPEFSLRKIDMKNLLRDAEQIWKITNTALSRNWGYVPVDRGVMEDMVRRLKPILDADAVWFIEDRNKPVGFALGFPDINPILTRTGGRLFPFGFIRLLRGKKTAERYRLLSLAVLPEYHGRGLDVLLYRQLYRALSPKITVLEANYILEDNLRIRNALEKLGLRQIKRYRIYEKAIPLSSKGRSFSVPSRLQ
jgi:ribosomal protein S18 acetylase RimI-like enzyme